MLFLNPGTKSSSRWFGYGCFPVCCCRDSFHIDELVRGDSARGRYADSDADSAANGNPCANGNANGNGHSGAHHNACANGNTDSSAYGNACANCHANAHADRSAARQSIHTKR